MRISDWSSDVCSSDLNTPAKIPEGVRGRIRDARGKFDRIFVLYGDCGTGGLLDQVLAEEGVERIDGPHCYSFFAGAETFDALAEAAVGTFYLTDYLVRPFERSEERRVGTEGGRT